MIIYEVNLDFGTREKSNYLPWLGDHAKKMVESRYFAQFRIYVSESGEVVVHYFCSSQELLDKYFSHGAEKMRAQGVQRFGQQLKATRRVLVPLET